MQRPHPRATLPRISLMDNNQLSEPRIDSQLSEWIIETSKIIFVRPQKRETKYQQPLSREKRN